MTTGRVTRVMKGTWRGETRAPETRGGKVAFKLLPLGRSTVLTNRFDRLARIRAAFTFSSLVSNPLDSTSTKRLIRWHLERTELSRLLRSTAKVKMAARSWFSKLSAFRLQFGQVKLSMSLESVKRNDWTECCWAECVGWKWNDLDCSFLD